nr:S1 family peptidase [Streptomyces sp. NBC_00998]
MDSRQWLVTAGHCYGLGETVYTAGGNRVGTVGAKLDDLDSAFIETPTSRYTWDGVDAQGYTRYLNGVRNAAVGDYTCQLGYTSKVVCNTRTAYAGNATWVNNGAYVWGKRQHPEQQQHGRPARRQRRSRDHHQQRGLAGAERHGRRGIRLFWRRHESGLQSGRVDRSG